MRKILKKFILVFFISIATLLMGLIINNRVFYLRYSKSDTRKDYLSEQDLKRVQEIYSFLSAEGSNIFEGFDVKDTDLLIYNEEYEFLFSDFQPSGKEWINLGSDNILNKYIFRRLAIESQAFAVKIDSKWVGSFATMDTYHKQMLNMIPIFYPPQLVSIDEQYYRAIVIHEMAHAYQGKLCSVRVDKAEHIHNVCSDYYMDKQFNDLIEQEAKYLELALQSENSDDICNNIQMFLQTRSKRRKDCLMSNNEIHEEQEIEWLEGLARYAEYKASSGSSSPIAKGLLNITSKVNVKSDDRYYALGMAQYMLIIRLDSSYEQLLFSNNLVLEDVLSELCLVTH